MVDQLVDQVIAKQKLLSNQMLPSQQPPINYSDMLQNRDLVNLIAPLPRLNQEKILAILDQANTKHLVQLKSNCINCIEHLL